MDLRGSPRKEVELGQFEITNNWWILYALAAASSFAINNTLLGQESINGYFSIEQSAGGTLCFAIITKLYRFCSSTAQHDLLHTMFYEEASDATGFKFKWVAVLAVFVEMCM